MRVAGSIGYLALNLNKTGRWEGIFRFSSSLDLESIASQCMDIHRNPRIPQLISIKAWIIED